MQKEELAKYLDYTILKQDVDKKELITLCENAKKYNFKAVCVSPCYVKFCKSELINTDVAICTVIGFPHGLNTTKVKIFEGKDAVDNGADELDIVINNSYTKSGQFDLVEKELTEFCKEIKLYKPGIIIKVIIETCLLTEEEKTTIAKIVKNSGADFVKTSTGFSKGGATIEDVKLLRQAVGPDFLIKASGGIRDYKVAMHMIEAGANRLGVSAAVQIIEDME